MASLDFTNYVRSLEPGGPPPDPELFQAFWDKLRSAIRAELNKRSLWRVSPGYLGIHGYAEWSEPALDELQAEIYTFILDRLPGIRSQLEVKPNVEGLVFRNLHNFLYDTQKKHDPVGFRTFEVLRAAVRQLIRARRLHVLRGESAVRNDTVVGFERDTDPAAAVPPHVLEAPVRQWNDALLPELVSARGKKKEEVVTRLAEAISRLFATGVAAFLFKDLADFAKRDVRARWSGLWSHERGTTAREDTDSDKPAVVIEVHPRFGVEERDTFDKLLACMEEALDQTDPPEGTESYLARLWTFLRDQAAGDDDKMPSGRGIARILGIPRDRLPDLQSTLGGWLRACRGSLGRPTGQFGKSAVKGEGE